MAASSSVKTFGKLWIKPFEEEELIFDGDDDSDYDEGGCGGAVSNASPMEVNTDSEPDYGYNVHVMELLADLGADRREDVDVAAHNEENNVAFLKAQVQAQSVAPLASSCEATGAEQTPANVPVPEIKNNSVRTVNENDDLPPLLEVEGNLVNDSPSSYSSSSTSSDDDSDNNSMQTVLEQPLSATLTPIPEEEEKQEDEQDPLGILPMEIEVERTENEPEGDNEAENMATQPDVKANEENGIDSDEIDPIVYLKSRIAERKKLLFKAVHDGRYKNARNLLDELVQTSDELNSLLPDYKYNLKLAHTEKSINAYWAERNAKRGRKRKTEQALRKSGRIKAVKNGTYASM